MVDTDPHQQARRAAEEIAEEAVRAQSLEDVSELLRTLRRRHARANRDSALTYRELARRTGWSTTAIAEYFAGRTLPPTDRFDALLEVLGAAPADLRALADARDRADESQRRARKRRSGQPPAPASAPLSAAPGAGPVPNQARGRQDGPVLRQLPADTGVFTGRVDELKRLLALGGRDLVGSGPGAAVIAAIDGMAGIGKTALALRAGHLLADLFPDGQLFIDLHGHTPGLPARDPAEALSVLLGSLGLPPRSIPEGLDARAAVYRARLAGTRTLVVIDNAAEEAQVRPLLPASSTCLVLVTSRKRLRALEDARALSLDVLPPQDAASLLQRMLAEESGTGDVDQTRAASLADLARLCGYLPLALRIAAAHLRHRPSYAPRDLVDALSAKETAPHGSVGWDLDLTPVFDLSYQRLGQPHRALFRRLGLSPGPDIDAPAAGALADADPAAAARMLQDLVDDNLLGEPSPGRYRLHDLLRAYAQTLAAESDSAESRDAAVERLLNYYQSTAAYADTRISRHTRARSAPPVSALSDPEQARAWLRIERANLAACLSYCADRKLGAHVLALSAGMATLLRIDGPWPQALAIHAAALISAERRGDRQGQAEALGELAAIRRLTSDFPEALRDAERALDLYQRLEDRQSTANALNELASLQQLTADYPAALRNQEAALAQYLDLGDRLGQANALIELGTVRQLTGDAEGSLHDLTAALDLYRALGNPSGQADALARLGTTRYLTGDFPGALQNLEAALDQYRRLGERLGQAKALQRLGTVRQMTGDRPGAMRDLETAMALGRSLGDLFSVASTLVRLGQLRRVMGDGPGALRDQEDALRLFRELDDWRGRANALTESGIVRQEAGEYARARQDLEEAVGLFRDGGSLSGESWALNYYAAVLLATGERARAADLYREALRLNREVHQPDDEALSLEGLGRCLAQDGDVHGAGEHLMQALAIFRRLAMPDAERIRVQLAQLGAPWADR
jgi:tetratricopeptide (TPR) repeat protein